MRIKKSKYTRGKTLFQYYTFVVFPLTARRTGVRRIGIWYDAQELRWPDDLVARLQLVAILLANTLARKRSEEEVRRLTIATEDLIIGSQPS